MDVAAEGMEAETSWRALPIVSQLVIVMSVPLYLGYFIKNLLLPSAVFMVMYPWSVISFLTVPALCLAETVALIRLRRGVTSAAQHRSQRVHAVGLAIGLGAMLSAFLVRVYG